MCRKMFCYKLNMRHIFNFFGPNSIVMIKVFMRKK